MKNNKLIILKYGGSSVSNEIKIKKIAQQIKSLYNQGYKILVVISAMGKFTDDLLSLAYNISKNPLSRELDVILTTGERISMALLSIALNDINIPAISFTGSQAGIITDCSHTKAKIVNIRPIRIQKELENNRVVIVAGFQGVSTNKNITTLGRGGSDLTAIALSIYFDAHKCIINTDVNGIFPIDPSIDKNVKPYKTLSLDDAVLLASFGAKVMHDRACVLASLYNRDYIVKSTFSSNGGTMISNNNNNPKNYNKNYKNTNDLKNNNTNTNEIKENLFIKAITSKNNLCLINIPLIKNKTKISVNPTLSIFSENNINIDYFYSTEKNCYIYLTNEEFEKNLQTFLKNNIMPEDKNLSVIHIIGQGLNFFPGFINKINTILNDNNIEYKQLFFQGQIVSIFIDKKYNIKNIIKILYNNLKQYFPDY